MYYSGTVEKIGIFEFKMPAEKRQDFNVDHTHTISVILTDGPKRPDGKVAWLTVASVKKDPERDLTWRRQVNGEYQDIYEGAQVEFMYDTREYNGQTYWNPKMKTFEVKENGTTYPKAYIYHKREGSSPQGDTGGGNSGGGYDLQGAIKGNALKCTLQILGGDLDHPAFEETLFKCKKINETLQKSFGDTHHGATIGMCLYEAAQFTKDVEKVEGWAVDALEKMTVVDTVFEDGYTPTQGEPEEVIDDSEIPF